ncbi:MAG: membrane protein insertase YidC [Alphaproteobacteria bacterium]|nr:membrane protein insertase YidC [Alphaproteobacteria bacterium]MBL0717886.1 membrane protein insertase YidC [Alphaproteobacteria bacterium]
MKKLFPDSIIPPRDSYKSTSEVKKKPSFKKMIFLSIVLYALLLWLFPIGGNKTIEEDKGKTAIEMNKVLELKEDRVKLENGDLSLSLNLYGNRIDDFKNRDIDTPLLSSGVRFIEIGESTQHKDIKWEIESRTSNSIVMKRGLDNKTHIVREVKLLEDRILLSDTIINNSNTKSILLPYTRVVSDTYISSDSSIPFGKNGAIYSTDEKTEIVKFKKIDGEDRAVLNKEGMLGFTYPYHTTLLQSGIESSKLRVHEISNFVNTKGEKSSRYQVDQMSDAVIINSGENTKLDYVIYSGIKRQSTINGISEGANSIPDAGDSIVYGLLKFLTYPMLKLLEFLHTHILSLGLGIMLFTIIIKLLMSPLTRKAFGSMDKMRLLHPEMTAIQKQFKGNPSALQIALLGLYKKHKVNPFSGFFFLLLQMPIYIAIYKVLIIDTDLYNNGFLWIESLHKPETVTVLNLFGLIPWAGASELLVIGVLPLLMAITMWMQQKLQTKISGNTTNSMKWIKYLPWVFMFLFATMPSGVMIYWVLSNILMIVQLYIFKKIYI